MIKRFARFFTENEEVRDLLDRLERFFEPIVQDPSIGAPYIKNISLAAGSTTNIAHTLGEIPSGWTVTRKNSNANVWEAKDPDSNFLYLTASASVTITIKVW